MLENSKKVIFNAKILKLSLKNNQEVKSYYEYFS